MDANYCTVQRLLLQDTENALIQPLNYTKVTALQVAAWQGNIHLLNQLIEKGADVNDFDTIGRTAFYYAAHCGHIDVTRRLLHCGADIDAEVKLPSDSQTENWKHTSFGQKLPFPVCSGRTPLHQAVENKHVDIVRILVERGARVDIWDERSTTPLLLAGISVKNRDDSNEVRKFFEIVTILVSAGVLDINEIHKETGTTVLHHATMLGSVETIELLMAKGAHIYQCKKFGNTPFHIAARAGDSRALFAILNLYGYCGNMRDHMSRTALHTAVFHGHRECVKILTNHGADLAAAMENGITPINAIFTHMPQPVQLLTDILDSHVLMIDNPLVKDEECVNTKDRVNETSISFNGNFEILKSSTEKHEMAVIMAIIDSASDISQLTILQHPLIETFLHLKWTRSRIVFFVLMLVHLSYVVCLSIIAPMFIKNNTIDILSILRILNVCSFFLLTHNLVQVLLEPKRYLKQVETWLSILCALISLATAIGSEFIKCDKKKIEQRECAHWILHCLSIAVFLSWLHTMLLIGRHPLWKYYALTFFTVLQNVLKVILTFGCLIVGFALSFVIVFQGKDQVGTLWKAIVSTVVMMIGEYQYTDLFNNNSTSLEKNNNEDGFLPITARIIFFIFIIFTSIILINLITGLTVNDIHSLEKEGHIRRLVKQAEFIAHLERLASHEIFNTWLYSGLSLYLSVDSVYISRILSPRSNYFQMKRYPKIPNSLMEALFLLAIKTSRKK